MSFSVVRRVQVVTTATLLAFAACGDDGGNSKLPDAGPIDAPPPAPAQLRLQSTTANFGSVVVGQTSASMSIVLGNVGMGMSGSISANVGGANSSNFTLVSTDCTNLAPGATCTVNLTFTPSAAGARSAELVVTASPGGSATAALDGIGLTPGALTINPSTHGFGNREVGTMSTTQTFTVQNTGGQPTSALTTTIGGANPGEFNKVTDGCNGMTLASGANCTFTVRFAPASAGSKFATFRVAATMGGAVTAAVNGVGLAPANLVINPPGQDFGSVVVAGNSSDVTFNVVNIGGIASGALAQSITGTNAGDFSIVSGTCMGAALNPGSSCSVLVRFTPGAAGARMGRLSLTGTPGGTVNADLTGSGITPGALVISPSTQAYPNTVVGTQSAPVTFTVTNTGGSTTGPLSSLIGGTDAGSWTITANGCQVSGLAPNGSCTVAVAFAPPTVGTMSAQLIVSAQGGATVQAGLSGNSVPAAQLSISPVSRAYGSVGVGLQSAFQTFTVQNTGGTATGVPTVGLTGANANQFNQTNDCTGALAPAATCTISVRFSPTAIGNFTATVSVTGTPGGSANANVFGQGVDPAALSVNPSALPFPGITLIGDASGDLSFTVTNNGATATGTLTVAITGLHAGDFELVNNSCTTLAPGASCVVTGRFRPTARGAREAAFVVSGTPGGSVSVAASGDALPRLEVIEIDEDPVTNPYDFGTHSVGSFTCVEVIVRNNTSSTQTLGINTNFGMPAQFDLSLFGCPGQKEFIIFGGGPNQIEAFGERSVWVSFAPSSIGPKTGTATFDIGAGVLNQAIQTFIGNGVEPLSITAVTTSNFGATAVDASSHILQFRVRNADDAQPTGSLATDAIQTQRFRIVDDDCDGQNLFPGDECMIDVVFEPQVLGPDQAVLSVTAVPGGAPSINMNGTGVTGYLLGGTITGNTGTVTLVNNFDVLNVAAVGSGSASGTFVFQKRVGSVYNVQVQSHPPGQFCTVTNGSGVIENADVMNVVVTCEDNLGILITPPGVAWGSHGACSGWNDCGTAQTCALWACQNQGYQNVVSHDGGRSCMTYSTCHLFFQPAPNSGVQFNWGNWCGVFGVGEIRCSNPINP